MESHSQSSSHYQGLEPVVSPEAVVHTLTPSPMPPTDLPTSHTTAATPMSAEVPGPQTTIEILPRRFTILAKHAASLESIVQIEGTSEPVYFVEVSNWTLSGPNVSLHAGNKHGPVVAAARLSKLSGMVSIILGDGLDKHAAGWQKMRSEILSYTTRWVYNSRPYVWKSTHHVDGETTVIQHMKLLDELSGDVVAMYVRKTWSIGTRGTVRLRDDLGAEWEALTVLSALALTQQQSESTTS
jgi:hypothetical protein